MLFSELCLYIPCSIWNDILASLCNVVNLDPFLFSKSHKILFSTKCRRLHQSFLSAQPWHQRAFSPTLQLRNLSYLLWEALLEDLTDQWGRCSQSVGRSHRLFRSCSATSNGHALLPGCALQTCQLDQVLHAGGVHHVLLLISITGFFITEERSKISVSGHYVKNANSWIQ